MRRISKTLWTLLAMAFLAEAWIWDTFGPVVARAVALVPLDRAKSAVRSGVARLSPWATLPVFVLPALVLTPFKLAAMWLLANGHPVLGVGAFLLAKTVGLGVTAFLFDACRPNLMRLGWFVALHARVLAAKAWAHRMADPHLARARHVARRMRDAAMRALPAGRNGRKARLIRARMARGA